VFLETVGTHIVQLRTGPAADYTQKWYSPVSSMTIFQVETICDDPSFLVYEARLTELSNSQCPNESIVIHLPGQTLTSHYAVQAISKGFTVCTEFETPKALTCKTFTARKLILVVNEQYRKSVLHARQVSAKVTPTKSVLAWSVSVIQGLGATDKTLESVKLIVAAGSILARTGIALCLGEHRHFWGFGPGRYRVIACAPTYPPFEMISCLSESTLKPDRESVYANVFELDWNDITHWQRMQGIMLGVEYDFNLESWSSSYGGPKWGQCAQATSELIQAMMPFLLMTENKPGLGDWCNQVVHKQLNAVMAAANKLITLSHNSGKCLTKLISQSELTKISFGYTGIHLATSPLTWKLVK
jgi:hypothetical protein